MRSCLRACAGAVTALGIAAAPIALAASASAAPYVVDPATALNTTNPDQGGPLTVTGSGWADTEVRVDLHSEVVTLGTVNVDADGSFKATFTLPASFSCAHFVTSTGLTSGTVTRNSIVIGECEGSGGEGAGEDDGLDLPRTGTAAAGLGLAGLALAGSGIALRRAASHR